MNASHNVPGSEYSRELSLRRSGTALKAARLLKGLSRKEAARICGCSHQTFEQMDNARTGFSDARLQGLVEGLGYAWSDFLAIRQDPYLALRSVVETAPKKVAPPRPHRHAFKIITKEVRVLKVLRQRKGLSQDKASYLCGYGECVFGQIENGRVDISPERITHILNSLGVSSSDFESLMKSERLTDEILDECHAALKQLDEHSLVSAQMIIRSLQKAR